MNDRRPKSYGGGSTSWARKRAHDHPLKVREPHRRAGAGPAATRSALRGVDRQDRAARIQAGRYERRSAAAGRRPDTPRSATSCSRTPRVPAYRTWLTGRQRPPAADRGASRSGDHRRRHAFRRSVRSTEPTSERRLDGRHHLQRRPADAGSHRSTQENVNKPFAIIVDNQRDLGAQHQRADPGWQSVDLAADYTVESANQLAIAAALRRVADRAARHRRADRQRRPRQRFDPRRHPRLRDRGGSGDRLHAGHLRPVRRVCEPGGDHQRAGHHRRAGADRRHADAARHRRLRADDRHRGRRQRADQRAHPRGTPPRPQRPPVGRSRLQGGEPAPSWRRTSRTRSRA